MLRIIAILLSLGLTQPIGAQDGEVDFRDMWLVADLPVEILVGTDPPAEKAGLTEEMLGEAVELGLRRNKVPLFRDYQDRNKGLGFGNTFDDPDCRAAIDAIPPGETVAPPECAVRLDDFLRHLESIAAPPVLAIWVRVLNIQVGSQEVGYSYFVLMQLWKPIRHKARVLGEEAKANVVPAEIWKDVRLGIVGNTTQLKEAVRSTLSEYVDALSLDYHRATAELEAHVRSP